MSDDIGTMGEGVRAGTGGDGHGDGGEVHAHVVPLPLLIGVFASLVVLTALTVAVTRFDLGSFNLWLAMLIAGAKASLVALFFMHLRWDKPFHGFIFLGAVVFVVLFIGLAMMDSSSYRPELIPGYAPRIHQ